MPKIELVEMMKPVARNCHVRYSELRITLDNGNTLSFNFNREKAGETTLTDSERKEVLNLIAKLQA